MSAYTQERTDVQYALIAFRNMARDGSEAARAHIVGTLVEYGRQYAEGDHGWTVYGAAEETLHVAARNARRDALTMLDAMEAMERAVDALTYGDDAAEPDCDDQSERPSGASGYYPREYR